MIGRYLIGLSLTFIIACSYNDRLVESTCKEKIDPDCICTMQYDPVCGCNNKTYGNACVAECSGITEYTEGECP